MDEKRDYVCSALYRDKYREKEILDNSLELHLYIKIFTCT